VFPLVCCSVLQYVASCCSVLQCVASCCGRTYPKRNPGSTCLLQSVAICCSALQCVAVCCIVLQQNIPKEKSRSKDTWPS